MKILLSVLAIVVCANATINLSPLLGSPLLGGLLGQGARGPPPQQYYRPAPAPAPAPAPYPRPAPAPRPAYPAPIIHVIQPVYYVPRPAPIPVTAAPPVYRPPVAQEPFTVTKIEPSNAISFTVTDTVSSSSQADAQAEVTFEMVKSDGLSYSLPPEQVTNEDTVAPVNNQQSDYTETNQDDPFNLEPQPENYNDDVFNLEPEETGEADQDNQLQALSINPRGPQNAVVKEKPVAVQASAVASASVDVVGQVQQAAPVVVQTPAAADEPIVLPVVETTAVASAQAAANVAQVDDLSLTLAKAQAEAQAQAQAQATAQAQAAAYAQASAQASAQAASQASANRGDFQQGPSPQQQLVPVAQLELNEERITQQILQQALPSVIRQVAPQLLQQALPLVVNRAVPQVVYQVGPQVLQHATPQVVQRPQQNNERVQIVTPLNLNQQNQQNDKVYVMYATSVPNQQYNQGQGGGFDVRGQYDEQENFVVPIGNRQQQAQAAAVSQATASANSETKFTIEKGLEAGENVETEQRDTKRVNQQIINQFQRENLAHQQQFGTVSAASASSSANAGASSFQGGNFGVRQQQFGSGVNAGASSFQNFAQRQQQFAGASSSSSANANAGSTGTTAFFVRGQNFPGRQYGERLVNSQN